MTQDHSTSPGDEADAEDSSHGASARRAGRPAFGMLQKAATTAHAEGDYAAALKHWAELRKHYPGPKMGLLGAIRAARAASEDQVLVELLDEVLVALMGESRTRSPANAKRAGRLATPPKEPAGGAPNGATPDADEERWQAMMQSPPTNAAAELDAAMAPFAGERHLHRKLQAKAALARIEAVVKRYPRDPASRVALISTLRRMKRGAKAVPLAARYAAAFPKSEKLALAHLGTLDDAGNFTAALEVASALREQSAGSVKAEVAYIQALSRLSRLDAADAACRNALATFPDSIDLLCEHASLATRRGDWTEALSRWMAAQQLKPDSNRIKSAIQAVQNQLAELQLPGTEFQEGETGAFFAQFESMGGTDFGCEFGMVQRKYGSASLGLLRWSAIEIESLTKALNNNFDGLGLLENTALGTIRVSATREEWLIRDKTYGIGSHTFIDVRDVPEDKMLIQTARRLKFLGGKLLEDIRGGLKILVYKIIHPADDDTIRRLYQAVRSQGPSQLLCIMKADDNNPKGSLRTLEEGLMVGYLGHYMAEIEVAAADKGIDFALWKDLTTRAAAAFAPLRSKEATEG